MKEDQKNWNNGHARAFEYFGRSGKIVVPDNLKTGSHNQTIMNQV
jgi:hypothetical protein